MQLSIRVAVAETATFRDDDRDYRSLPFTNLSDWCSLIVFESMEYWLPLISSIMSCSSRSMTSRLCVLPSIAQVVTTEVMILKGGYFWLIKEQFRFDLFVYLQTAKSNII